MIFSLAGCIMTSSRELLFFPNHGALGSESWHCWKNQRKQSSHALASVIRRSACLTVLRDLQLGFLSISVKISPAIPEISSRPDFATVGVVREMYAHCIVSDVRIGGFVFSPWPPCRDLKASSLGFKVKQPEPYHNSTH